MLCSVGFNGITGDGAEALAKAVLESASLTDFCSIPLVLLRENSVTELDLNYKGVGVPGAIVLSSLVPAATALTSLKYARKLKTHGEEVLAAADTPFVSLLAVCSTTASVQRVQCTSQRA